MSDIHDDDASEAAPAGLEPLSPEAWELVAKKANRSLKSALEAGAVERLPSDSQADDDEASSSPEEDDEDELEAVFVLGHVDAAQIGAVVEDVVRDFERAGLRVKARPYSRNMQVQGSRRALKRGLADDRVRAGILRGVKVKVRDSSFGE